jgi:phosphatidate cytidylyltransferase
MSTVGAQPPPTPRTSKRAKIWRRTVVGGGLALALTALLWTVHATQSNVLVLALGAVFAGLCVYEGTHLPVFRGLHLQAPAWAAWLVAIGMASLFEGRPPHVQLPATALASICVAALIVAVRSRAGVLITGVWMCAWLVLPFTWLHHVESRWGVAGLVALVILSKLGDIAGYYAGSAFGRHHPFKALSPGKTTEGCLASLAAGIAAGAALVHFELLPREPYGLWGGAAVGAITNIAAQAGDLFESWVKRKAGVKDSGTWFGPSGGVLDLVDSFLFSIPAALTCWPLLLEVVPVPR